MAHLEVISAAASAGVAEGQIIGLDGRRALTIGRFSGVDLRLPSGLLSRQHCRMSLRDGQWRIEDLDSTNGVFVQGRAVVLPQPVPSGALIDVGGAVIFRFVDGLMPPGVPLTTSEPRVAEAPDDDGRWLVWADELSEQGHPWGEWVLGGVRTHEQQARMMGVLGRRFTLRRLQFEWNRHGFLSSLRLPFSTLEEAASALWLLEHLDLVPVARFLERLEVELLPAIFVPRLSVHTLPPAEATLEAVARARLPRTLTQLRLEGRIPSPDLPPSLRKLLAPPRPQLLRAAIDHVRGQCPRWQPPEGDWVHWVEG